MQNEAHCSSDTPTSLPTSAPNAFRPEFLRKIIEREDAAVAGVEAELRGPWQVLELPPAGGGDGDGGGGDPDADAERWVVLGSWENPEEAEPTARFLYREHALLWAAALEVASRGSNLGVGLTRDSSGQVITEWNAGTGTRRLGHAKVWDEDVAAAVHVLDALLRIPEALARVVEAGGAPIVELLGRRLVSEE
jgi:hypothetical protein